MNNKTVLRAICVFLIIAVVLCVFSACTKPPILEKETTTQEMFTLPEPDYTKWKSVYEEYLLSIIDGGEKLVGYEYDVDQCRFDLVDLDGDEVFELLISEGESPASRVNVYGYDGYEIRFAGGVGIDGEIEYIEGKSAIFIEDKTEKQTSYTLYTYSDCTLTENWSAAELFDEVNSGEYIYYCGSDEVDEETYKAQLEQYLPKETKKFGRDGFKLTRANAISVIETGKATDTQGDSDWKEEYKTVLLNLIKEKEELHSYAFFSLAYIDSDSVPELIFSLGDFHSSLAEIYTIVNGKAEKVGEAGSHGQIAYVEKQGKIFGNYNSAGINKDTVYLLEDGKMNVIFSCSHTSLPDTQGEDPEKIIEEYFVNEEKVEKEKYEEAYENNISLEGTKTNPNEETGEGFYKLSAENVNKVFAKS